MSEQQQLQQPQEQQQQDQQQDTNAANKLDLNESQYQNRNINETYKESHTSRPHYGLGNRNMIALIVYLALLLDNVLLTVIGN